MATAQQVWILKEDSVIVLTMSLGYRKSVFACLSALILFGGMAEARAWDIKNILPQSRPAKAKNTQQDSALLSLPSPDELRGGHTQEELDQAIQSINFRILEGMEKLASTPEDIESVASFRARLTGEELPDPYETQNAGPSEEMITQPLKIDMNDYIDMDALMEQSQKDISAQISSKKNKEGASQNIAPVAPTNNPAATTPSMGNKPIFLPSN